MSDMNNNIINILHVITRLPVGGVENMLLKVVKGYDKRKYHALICCIKEGGAVADELEKSGYEVLLLNKMKKRGFNWGVIKHLRDIIKERNIHILRTHQYHANLYGRIAGILAGVPAIIPSFHNVYESPDKPKFHRRIFNYLLSLYSSSLVAVSNRIVADMIRYDRVSPEKIKVIHNGIPLEKFESQLSREDARKVLNLSQNDFIIGTVGRLTEQKGHRYLIDAVSRMRNVCTVIAGDGPLMEEMRDYVNRNKINCIFPGRMSNEKVPTLMRALDVFCFPSLWEGFATALVEAMAAGLPIVASDIPPHREVLGDAGLFVKAGDAASLSESLHSLISHTPFRSELGKRARERARVFSIENTVKAYQDLFEDILQRKGIL
jgi:glycosyltransferase involved in cell wall biosynthesis